MSTPSSPYCTSAQVAYAAAQLLYPGTTPTDFADDGTTKPTKTEVEFWIQSAAAEIDAAFLEAGYKVPFAIWSAEDWIEAQSSYLQFLNVLGAAAQVVKTQGMPAGVPGREESQPNVYEDKFQAALDKIREGKSRFRADCFSGSLAWQQLRVRRAPMTDFGEGIIDGMDHLEMTEYTLLRMAVGDTWAAWGGASDVSSYDWDTMRSWGKR